MHVQSDKSTDTASKSPENSVQRRESAENELVFEDQRPGYVAQRKFNELVGSSQQVTQAARLQAKADVYATGQPVQLKTQNNGLPDQLKSGIEQLSGYSLNDVQVHYNSDKPAQLQAHAYAQGADIFVGPGQEQHLPHEAWHV